MKYDFRNVPCMFLLLAIISYFRLQGRRCSHIKSLCYAAGRTDCGQCTVL